MKRNRFLNWFLNQKLGKKILYTVVFVAAVPFLIIEGMMFMVIARNMSEKVDELMYSQLTQTAERTTLTLDIYTNLVYQIYTDNEVVEGILVLENGNEQESAKAHRTICDQLQKYGLTASGIECISIILPDGRDVTYDFGMASVVDNLWNDCEDMCSITPYVKAAATSDMAVSPTEQFVRNGEEERIFHISRRMYDFNDIQRGPVATVVVSVNESVLNAVCNPEQENAGAGYSVTFITDDDRNILSYPDGFYAGITLEEDTSVEGFVRGTGRFEDVEVAINTYKDNLSGWTYYNVYDKSYMFRDVRRLEVITLLAGILLFALSTVFTRYIIKLVEHSVQGIMNGIRQVQNGNLDIKVPVESTDEMGQIAGNLNTMTDRVKDLIRKVENIGEKQRKAEIKALEAQINPHFLYNTLDSINWMAIEKEEYEISRMLRNLGVILRYSVNKSNQMVTVEEMADWLEKYVSLHQMRFNHSFSCDIYIEEQTKKIRIYKLLIQPFIENSILHGFKGIESGGMLRVDARLSEDGDTLDIIIEDNGRGMPRETAEKYNRMAKEEIEDERGIGLSNAFMRMRLYYGQQASWDVSSIEGIGTIITLKLPVKTGTEEKA